ncbi:MAG: hypothetical protein AAF357_08420 [Verrucomicrobiota bacterium]
MKKIKLLAFIGTLVLALIAFILFTPWGVHFYGEVLFSENETREFQPGDHPVVITDTLTAVTKPLPAAVMQPSGIDSDAAGERFFIVTDQAEIIELDQDFERVIPSVIMSQAPLLLRQGTIESNDFYDSQLYVSGDLGEVEIWSKEEETWIQSGEVEIAGAGPTEIGSEGLAIHPGTREIYMGDDTGLHVLDKNGTYRKSLVLTGEAKPNREASEYIIAGLDFHDGLLYVLTEFHSAILAVDIETGEIVEAFALDGFTEGFGLAVTDNAFYVVVDHEINEPSPGVKVIAR